LKIPSKNSESLEFHFQDYEEFPFPENKIRKWILFLIKNENQKAGILNFIFCSDDFLSSMNMDYLQHDTLTDIITFDYSNEFNSISGDIFISIDRIKENADNFAKPFLNELCRIIAHGVLHICGYGDKQVNEKAVMQDKEDYYLSLADFLVNS
jgi:rRNA maturation RNase YbeY